MTKCFKINGVDTPIPEGSQNFADFIDTVNTTLTQEKLVIARVRINGREVSEIEEKAFAKVPMEELGVLEIDTANPVDLAYETLNTLEQYVDKLAQTIAKAATYYTEKNFVAGDAYFSKSIDGLDLLVQTIGGIKLALRVGLNPKVALTEAALVSIMNDLLESKRQNNYVFLAELLSKDLVGNLDEWKQVVFPIFRSIHSS